MTVHTLHRKSAILIITEHWSWEQGVPVCLLDLCRAQELETEFTGMARAALIKPQGT